MSNKISKINNENEELNLKAVKYESFIKKLQSDNEELESRMSFMDEENKELKVKFTILSNMYAQVKQTVFMLYGDRT
jgi:predicted nuclease with TOPRIM domain